MRDLQTRRLAAIYLVFLAALAAASVEPPFASAAAAASGGRLIGPAGGGRLDLYGRFGAVLRGLGFKAAAPSLPLMPISPLAREDARGIWSASPAEPPGEFLRRAERALFQNAEPAAARLLGSSWSVYQGYICRRLVFGAPEGRSVSLILLAKPPAPAFRSELRPRPRPAGGMEPRPAQPLRADAPSRSAPPPRKPRAAIILDDVGAVAGTEDFLALPIQLTVAVMPFCRYSELYAHKAREAGKTVLLHLPLEPLPHGGGIPNPGPGVIRTGWPPEQILAQLDADLKAVPGAVGVNNHMGSKATGDPGLMRIILAELNRRGLCFVDSRTTSRSVVLETGRTLGIRCAANEMFLDGDDGPGAVEAMQVKLRELIAAANKEGEAVGICHANRPYALEALRAALPEFEKAGVEIVPVTELAR